MNTESKVKKYLEEECGYDFANEFWTDDMKVMLQEIISATHLVINKNRGYTMCTIDSGTYGRFEAKVAFSEVNNTWDPVEVLFEGQWISIEDFDGKDGFNNYGCENYRRS